MELGVNIVSNVQTDKEVGERIRAMRKSANISLEALAKYLNITADYLRAIENGRSSTKVSRYIAIAKSFNVSLDYLFTGTEYDDLDHPVDEEMVAFRRTLGIHDYQLLIKIANLLLMYNRNKKAEADLLYKTLELQLKFLDSYDWWK